MSAVAARLDEGVAQDALNARFAAIARAENLLPVKVTKFYQRKIDEEVAALGHREGPLHRTAYPSQERLDLHAGHEVADWVGDRSNMGAPGSSAIIHKYADRVLFMPTSVCAGHCQYCFRQDVLSDAHGAGRSDVSGELERLVAYLETKPDVSEVILSGGDPMMLPVRDLELVLETLRALPQIRSIRMHTRALAFAPKLFDETRMALLEAADVRLVFHFVHPYEVCGDVEEVLRRLSRRGLRLYNHFPLLRGVNDHVDVLKSLITRLDDCRVRTLSVYVPEPIRYSAPFRLTLQRFFALQDQLTETAPSWINAVRFTLDSPIGKVRREQIASWDEANGLVTFRRGGANFVYPDFPAALDSPGERRVMLWKEPAAE
ncbi:L-lysine 2,3-aminomutase [Hartmannibacter diazotrophicus]|uniref:L-lysine 2,3-aminomutase n=1 Tax=Hartmannibacter diazotrophicus TaxID=1482074 RepID=A0A2C9DBX6_9HYPH|nr:radical SAM protein [Hartmannibacter diazotrophicus]SON57638.1 L-lysine 2,3-aminomutase [Hartmannibacter diazotrophicus]